LPRLVATGNDTKGPQSVNSGGTSTDTVLSILALKRHQLTGVDVGANGATGIASSIDTKGLRWRDDGSEADGRMPDDSEC
jgi:hypothetical protein